MDAQRRRELTLKREEAKQSSQERARVDSFRTLIEPLDRMGIDYIVIPPGPELLGGVSALAALASFPFNSSGHLDSQVTIPKSEWQSIISDTFANNKRTYIAWKDSEYCVECMLSDILPAIEDLFIEYHWDAYLFDPFTNWVIESHHDGYLTAIIAEQDATGNPLPVE